MEFNNDEEALGFLNGLLERLQQADFINHGSKIELVYVAPGAQHVETQINIGASPCPPPKGEGNYADGENLNGKEELSPSPLPKERGKGAEPPIQPEAPTELIRHSIMLLMEERMGDEALFNLQSHWQAVYRILVDKGYCRDSDFDGFDAFIRMVMPEEVNKPYKKESVKQISKTDFILPFNRWHYDPQTSLTRKPFDRMVAVARRFLEILELNGL